MTEGDNYYKVHLLIEIKRKFLGLQNLGISDFALFFDHHEVDAEDNLIIFKTSYEKPMLINISPAFVHGKGVPL